MFGKELIRDTPGANCTWIGVSFLWVLQSGIRDDPSVVLHGRPVAAVVLSGKRVLARPLCLHLSDAGGGVSMDLDQQMQSLLFTQQAADRGVERLDAGPILVQPRLSLLSHT